MKDLNVTEVFDLSINEKSLNTINEIELNETLNNIKKKLEDAVNTKQYILAAKLKNFFDTLKIYIKQRPIQNDYELNKIVKKLEKLNKEIIESNKISYNNKLIDIHISKHKNEYINLLIIFIYKLFKINTKIFKILFVDYIKKIYNLILNTNKKKNMVYQFMII